MVEIVFVPIPIPLDVGRSEALEREDEFLELAWKQGFSVGHPRDGVLSMLNTKGRCLCLFHRENGRKLETDPEMNSASLKVLADLLFLGGV